MFPPVTSTPNVPSSYPEKDTVFTSLVRHDAGRCKVDVNVTFLGAVSQPPQKKVSSHIHIILFRKMQYLELLNSA